MYDILAEGGDLPIDLAGQVIYYMGPSPAREGRVIGSAGPTTASRMDKYTPQLLDLGMGAMIGKGKRSPEVIEQLRGMGLYILLPWAAQVRFCPNANCLGSGGVDDLGTEAIRKLTVKDFPAIVVIDSEGNNLYETAIKEYCQAEEAKDETNTFNGGEKHLSGSVCLDSTVLPCCACG